MKTSRNYTAIYATDPVLAGGVLFGRTDLTPLGPYLSCLETLGMEPVKAWQELGGESGDCSALVERAYGLQTVAARKLALEKKTLGLLIHEYSGPMFNQMQTQWAEALRDDPRFQLFLVISDTHLSPPASFLAEEFGGIPCLWAPPGDQLTRLDFIDVFVALDYAAEKMRRLPAGSLRILQPHGADILCRYSYMFYGAGLMFDYLLCPSFSPEIVPPNLGELLIDLFPREFVDHGAKELTLIPFGNMKLDSFINRCADAEPTDIIYNFSYWKLESGAARANSIRTVARLLEAFPDRRLVFRPFPGDEEDHRPLIERFARHPRFHLSRGNSYIEDYRNGAVLIHHRGSSAEIFSMATLQPSLHFVELNTPQPPAENDIGFDVYTLEQLVDLIGALLAKPRACSERLRRRRDDRYPTAGRSLPAFLDHLHCLLTEGVRQPEWRTLPLHSDRELTGRYAVEFAVAKALGQQDLVPMLATAAADAYPDAPLFQLYAAWSVFVHIYPAEFTPDPWLLATEYLAAFFRTGGEECDRLIAETGAENWLREQLTPRLLGLWSRSANQFTPDELERLRKAIAVLPLDPLAAGSIPWKLQARLGRKDEYERRVLDLLWTLAAVLHDQGRWREALELVQRAQPRSASEELLLCRLAWRTGNGPRVLERAYRLLDSAPSPAIACLLLQILASLPPSTGISSAAVEVVKRMPDHNDCLAFAINLARCRQDPALSRALGERLVSSAVPERRDWSELLSH